MNWTTNAERMRPAAVAAALLSLCLTCVVVPGQRGAERQAPPPRPGVAQRQAARQEKQQQKQYQKQPRQYQNQQRPYQNQQRPYQNQQRPYQQAPQSNGGQRPATAYPTRSVQPGYANPAYNRPAYPNAARPGTAYPGASPPGHLGDWLNRHQSLPVQDQERLLRNDPSF
ncbi:MAG: hypothetical protein WB341_11200, partial [Terracidiphilus sp.]